MGSQFVGVGEGGGGGCQTLMNSGGFYLCIDTAK